MIIKLYRKDVLEFAYRCCKANAGAPGVDGQDFADVESYGVERWLGELAEKLRGKTYRVLPARMRDWGRPGLIAFLSPNSGDWRSVWATKRTGSRRTWGVCGNGWMSIVVIASREVVGVKKNRCAAATNHRLHRRVGTVRTSLPRDHLRDTTGAKQRPLRHERITGGGHPGCQMVSICV